MFLSTHKFNYIKNWYFLSKNYTTSIENDIKEGLYDDIINDKLFNEIDKFAMTNIGNYERYKLY